MNRIPKAIALMSGGLDSALAAKIVKEMGVEVLGLHLVSPFGCKEDLNKVAKTLDIKMIFKEKGEAYLDLVKNPKFGYGKNMNPCIDCRIFMFQLADVVRQEEGADFIITGEVLGQRPMSQTREAMSLIDRKSPLEDRVLRPLSAHCFNPTLPEREGWVDREKLYSITGRGRKDQLRLVKELELKEFKSPGGGCLLTEVAFSERLRDFFRNDESFSSDERMAQASMLRLGRHFRLSDTFKAIVARNDIENDELEKLWKMTNTHFFSPFNFEGPVAIGIGSPSEKEKESLGAIIVRYGKGKQVSERQIEFINKETQSVYQVQKEINDEEIGLWRLGT